MSIQRVPGDNAPDTQLPATRTDGTLVEGTGNARPVAEWRQPIGVAFLPLALVTFIVIAFAMAMWTFLAATG